MDGIEQQRPGVLTPIIAGGLEARLANSELDIDAAQALRYRVFYEDLGARPTANIHGLRRDFDDFDAVCDHILVIGRDCRDPVDMVVGTYRVLRRSQADNGIGFKTPAQAILKELGVDVKISFSSNVALRI